MSETLREHLRATIQHMSMKRSILLNELEQTEQILKALYREDENLSISAKLEFPPRQPEGMYAGISVRWAILLFFAEQAAGPQPINVIAESLRAGGSTTKAQSFNSNVSAVLSQMVTRGELVKTDEGFSVTEHGKVVWHGIRNSQKFVNRNTGFAEEE